MQSPHRGPGLRTRAALAAVVVVSTVMWTGGAAIGAPVEGAPRTEGAPPADAAAACQVGGAIPADAIAGEDTLWRWTRRMAGYNFRHTGSEKHTRYLALVERQLTSYGLDVTRYPTPLAYWKATSWSLRVKDASGRRHDLPVAWYRPYSGQTPPAGVTGGAVDVGAGGAADYEGTDVRGKVVVADLRIPPFTAGGLAPLTLFAKDPAPATEDYSRIPFQGEAPDLELAKQHGAVAMVNIIDRTPAEARGQFYPHQQVQAGLPAVHLDRVQGARLRTLMAAGPVTATVVLTAVTKATTVDYLSAELPGSGALPGAIMVLTHTDGQNAVEENGVPAVLAMAEYFTQVPPECRPRDIIFLLSGVHMASHRDAVHSDVFLRQHPEITSRVKAALAPEHLGAMTWTEDRATGVYGPTGLSELALVPVGNSRSLVRLAIDALGASDLSRTYVLAPFNGLFGEGTGPYRLGIPTIGFISGPTYLVQVAPNANLDKLDKTLMHRQTLFLTRMLSSVLAAPAVTP